MGRELFELGDDPRLEILPVGVGGQHVANLIPPAGYKESEFRRVVGAAYTAYTYDGSLPNVNRIHEIVGARISKKKIGEIIDTEEFKLTMIQRGVEWTDSAGLTGQQMLALQVLTNPTDKRDLRAKLKSIGVTYPQYRGWLKQPLFNGYLNKVTEGMLTEHIGDFNTVLANKALGGDLGALKLAYELSGRYDPNHQQVTDMKAVMQALIEIVTRNVKDPEVLTRISNELHLTMVSHNIIKGEIAG